MYKWEKHSSPKLILVYEVFCGYDCQQNEMMIRSNKRRKVALALILEERINGHVCVQGVIYG